MSGSVFNSAQEAQDFRFQAGSTLPVTLPGDLGTLEPSPVGQWVHYTLGAGVSAGYGAFSKGASADRTLTGADMDLFIGTGTSICWPAR